MLNQSSRVRTLLARGANPTAPNATGTTAIELADFLHQLDVTKTLLAHLIPDLLTSGGYELLRAIRQKRPTVVRALLEMGVSAHFAADLDLFRAILLTACGVGNGAVVENLVRYGPGISIALNEALLVGVARSIGNDEVVRCLRLFAEEERCLMRERIETEGSTVGVPSIPCGLC